MSSLGFEVIGIDTDQSKVDLLSKGELPFYEPGLDTLLASEMKTGRLSFTTDFSAVADADVHFICVGTPQSKDGLAADLTYVMASVAAIAPHLKEGSLVVGKSTVPVGTAQLLRDQLSISAPQADLAWNPEFLREGFAVEDTLTPNRLVVGVANDRAEEILKEVYKPVIDLGTPWIRADLPTAELVKVAANSFLATKISFINAMAEVCEAAGGDVTVLAKAIGYDPRIGSRFLQAGIGFGGGCLPKDIRARQRVIDIVRADLSEDLTQYKIAVLGATFKPDSDDVRDSPALDIAAQLQAAGAQVVVHDPKGIEPARKRFPNLDYQEKVVDAVKGADAILHLTEWKEYRELDPSVIGQLVKSKLLIDGRNMLDRNKWRAAGWRFHALGRSD
jgi:UDPglucose 6-dehydrogenase